MSKRRYNRSRGVSIVELIGGMVLGIPLILTTLYTILEANQLFTIRTKMDLAARRAAQVLLNNYYANGTTTSTAAPSPLSSAGLTASVPPQFDIPAANGNYFVNHNANQFVVTWNTTTKPITVTVTAVYPKGGDSGNSILPFPYPDPLNLGPKLNIGIAATATFAASGP